MVLSFSRVLFFTSIVVLCFSAPAQALEIVDARWNFENLRVPGTFNFVTVTVENLDATAFDGNLTLRPRAPGMGPVGVPVRKRLILTPGGRARVQLYVFLTQDHHDWVLSWGRTPAQELQLELPPRGKPGQVFLRSPHLSVPAPEELRKFPERSFPSSAAVLATASELAVGHVPEWTPEQNRALSDWVRGGGVLHVFAEPSGKLPVFDGELSPLNGEFEASAWGAGRIVRYRTPAGHASRAQLAWPQSNEWQGDNKNYYSHEETHVGILTDLSRMVRPDHSWGLIYSLSLLYLILVVPVNAIIGKKVRDYRIAFLFLAVCVLLFSFVFMKVGARGYGETTTIQTIARAEVLGEGDYDVMRWSHAFVTRSDVYMFRYGDNHGYDSILRREAVRGVVQDTREGRGIVCEMPLFSSRDFVSRGTFRKPGVFVKSVVRRGVFSQGPIRDLKFEVGLGFPLQNHGMWVSLNGVVYELEVRSDGLLEVGARTDEFHEQQDQIYYNYDNSVREYHPEKTVIGQLIGAWESQEPIPDVPPGSIQILVVADLPAEFHNSGSMAEQGLVVYHQVLEE